MGKHSSLLIKDSSQHIPETSDLANETREDLQSSNGENICFVCNSRNQNIVPNNACTETSQTELKQKLVLLVSVELDLRLEDIGSICVNCAQILNCIDYVENMHKTLSKGILNHVKRNFGMEPTEHVNLDLCMKSLKNFTVCNPWRDVDESRLNQKQKLNMLVTSEAQHSHQSNKSSEVPDQFSKFKKLDHNEENQEIILLENGLANAIKLEYLECDICSYKTKFQAFMLFHVRQHFQSKYAYDSCPVEEWQTTDESCKIINDSECESDKLDEILPQQFSKPRKHRKPLNRDTLEKRNVVMTVKVSSEMPVRGESEEILSE
ncbi:Uncharacterized protein GBIM_01012, partial [Gryllus bimaculatus]